MGENQKGRAAALFIRVNATAKQSAAGAGNRSLARRLQDCLASSRRMQTAGGLPGRQPADAQGAGGRRTSRQRQATGGRAGRRRPADEAAARGEGTQSGLVWV